MYLCVHWFILVKVFVAVIHYLCFFDQWVGHVLRIFYGPGSPMF